MKIKTAAEQRLEILEATSRKRELTAAEQDDLRRAMHAVYCYNRRLQRTAA